MMIRQLKRLNVLRQHLPDDTCFAFAGYGRGPEPGRKTRAASDAVLRRPDARVISEAIPLFFIGRNNNGFWVVRGADARTGGMFLFKRSAMRFATRNSKPVGCATMFLTEPFELDVENKGSLSAMQLAAAMRVAARRLPKLFAFIVGAVAAGKKLITGVSRALASERRHRDAIEKELFRGQYTLSSKNDGDLPIP
jgi:hypothetical protein